MSVQNASLLTGPSIAATGGTALAFTGMGATNGKTQLFVASDTDFRIRRYLYATTKSPSPNASAPNGYTQQRSSVVYIRPFIAANGKIIACKASVEISYDVEASASLVQELRDVAAQVCFDADFSALWTAGSLA